MIKTYNDLDLLLADIQKDIDKTLKNEVLDVVKDTEIKHIKSEVLDVYEPIEYIRRKKGGIDDPSNIVGDLVSHGSMIVTNKTPFNPGYDTKNKGVGLADLINGGDGWGGYDYDYPFHWRVPYTDPRQFIDKTEQELDNSNLIENALEKGLIKKGIDFI